jgi:GNAT superfamily N-acetyltransferase
LNEPAELEVCIKYSNEMSAEEKAQLETLDHLAFPDEELNLGDNILWEPPKLKFLGKVDDLIVSNVGVVKREITVDNRKIVVGGIGGVATMPKWQKRGFARQLLDKANEHLRMNREFEFGMLFCASEKVHYYARCGYVEVKNPLFICLRGERKLFEDAKMVLQLSELSWAEGEVDVMGLPW